MAATSSFFVMISYYSFWSTLEMAVAPHVQLAKLAERTASQKADSSQHNNASLRRWPANPHGNLTAAGAIAMEWLRMAS